MSFVELKLAESHVDGGVVVGVDAFQVESVVRINFGADPKDDKAVVFMNSGIQYYADAHYVDVVQMIAKAREDANEAEDQAEDAADDFGKRFGMIEQDVFNIAQSMEYLNLNYNDPETLQELGIEVGDD